ncbi:nucleoside triphosphate pyrophosphatase [Tessaracoccus sp. OH4464_COT-324]|uniref:Maf family protein n=1 Tax=Tessaracoccus sp. OH4464_COT-324 TaxID=2491059 RepID=UPI000F6388BB|nr:nucleoside triphosphate pyrophosphatase [Tessaracoccus sp. OH4464_COT-324]RRD44749.1 septum formation inhibitor Maf [Tessaracoccus sp. OH4464_COT-324]
MRVVLASKSPSRLRVLRAAGIAADVVPSGFNESTIQDRNPISLSHRLAEAKGAAVAQALSDPNVVIFAADTVLETEGRAQGKPRTREAAVELWLRLRGHSAMLHTGHYVLVRRDGVSAHQVRVRSTSISFADLSEEEIEAYADTGEPINVAGGFSINGLGGAFITTISGDPFNVVGLSLPLVRQMVIDLGVPWHTLWHRPSPGE